MGAHSLVRIKQSMVNKPHLIDEESFSSIMEYVNGRIQAKDFEVDQTVKAESDSPSSRYVQDTKTGVLHVQGPLTYRTSGWEALCGGTSYEMLKGQMEYFVEQGAKTVAMLVDSGGGEAHGMMDSANYIRKLADDNGIKIIGFVDGMAASAGYGLVTICDEIVMTSDSMVGSIGVLIQLMNNSKQLEMNGIERTFITAGKDKVPFAEDGSFTKEFKDRLQEQVDTLYEGFTSHVATHRSLEVQAVKDTEANVFMADEALKLGLADKVMTAEEFYTYLADTAQNNLEGNGMGKLSDVLKFGKHNGDEAEMAQLEELQTQLTASHAELSTLMTAFNEQKEMVASLQTQLEQFKEMQALAEKAAADAKLESRKAALAEVMPVDQVETKLAAYAALDDNTFAFMVGELDAAKKARAESMAAVGSEGVVLEEEDETDEDPRIAATRAAAKARR